jgi:hypothetical protein
MPDYIGNIVVPEIVPSGTFPLVPDYPHGRAQQPEVVIHQFGSGNAKIEQRFLLGTGAKRFTVRRAWLRDSERIALRNFWESKYGPYGAFTYNAPNDDGIGTTPHICRFANEPLSWEMVADWACSVGVTLVEIPTTTPAYALNSTVTRFPSQALKDALLSQVQQVIPLVRIQPLQSGYPAIYLSDRRCTIGGQLYQARLIEFDGISQGMGNESDEATFTFGNADRVMRDLANDVDLYRADIEFSLYHVGTGIKLDLWKGNITNWACDAGEEFKVTASDGLYELNLPYPTRKISRTCWKAFNSQACPFAEHGALDLLHFPDADATCCDKGYDTPNGCLAHQMKHYFGGVLVEPQGVKVKDNSTGTWGFGRSPLTSVSLVSDSIYDQVIPEVYTDQEMPVNCKIAAGRDEGDFYEALGIVGEGPLVAFTTPRMEDKDGDGKKETFIGSTLDGQYNHGAKFDSNGNPTGTNLGLRTCLGNDPVGASDYFSLDQSGDQRGGDWRKVYDGYSTYKDNFAAGTAFIVIRRTDAKGLQLSQLTEHQMQAYVSSGIGGWVWTAPGERIYTAPLTNPIWIAVNMLLRARGIRLGAASTPVQLDIAETFFDVDAAVAAAGVCASSVPRLVGGGYETQFKFIGVLQEEKPLRDWLQEILMNCLGYYTFAFGKMKLGVRMNSSAAEAFTEGNILFRSLQLAPIKPSFNHLTANFADGEFQFQNNSVTLYDADNAALLGGGAGPLFLKSNVNLAGTASKSQAARIISVRLREELGGVTPDEWKCARSISFGTTVLALATEPGMVCSMTHPDMPGGAGEFRVTGWKLNKDYSIEIEGRTTTDSMYDMVNGPKPADVTASPIPIEISATIPDDVVPIGTDAFLFTKTEDGKNATYTLEYEPPDPIGIFGGVTLHVEAPDGSGKIAFTQDFDYNGNPLATDATRHGTCTFSFPQVLDAAVQIRMYLASRSRVYKNPLVLSTGAMPTPNRADVVAQGSISGLTPPPLPVSVVASEKPGSRVLDPPTQLTYCTVTVSLHFDKALPTGAWLNYWHSTDDGVGYGWLDKIPASGQDVTFEFVHLVPYGSDQTWKVKVATGVPGYEYPPDQAVESNSFLVPTLSPPANNLVRNAVISNVNYQKLDSGQYTFSFQIDYDTIVDPNIWLAEGSVQGVTADGTPCPEDPSGAEERFGIVQNYESDIPGRHKTYIVGPWWVPPAEWTGRTYRIRLYAQNRNGVRTVQLWPDGKDYFDLTPEVKYYLGGHYPNIQAPDVVQFDIGTQNSDGTFTRAPHWDTLNEKMIFDWAAYLPDDISNLGFVSIWFQRNGQWIESPMYFEKLTAEGLIHDSFVLTGSDIPQPGEQITFVCSSANKLGIHNQNPPGTPSGPAVTITIGAPNKGITTLNLNSGLLGGGLTTSGGQIVVKTSQGIAIDANGAVKTQIDATKGMAFDAQGRLVVNIDSTDFQFVAGYLKYNQIDMTRAVKFDTSEFQIDPGTATFKTKILSASKILTGTLSVGWGGDKPGQIAVYGSGGTMVGWIGQNGIYYGGWFKQLYIGGSDPSSAKLVSDSSGNLAINGGTFTLGLNGVQVKIDNGYDTYGYAGMTVKDISGGGYNTGRVIIFPNRIIIMDPIGNPLVDLIGNYVPGVIDSGSIIVKGSVQADAGVSGYQLVADNAIRIGATTVIDSNRNLVNVTLPAHTHPYVPSVNGSNAAITIQQGSGISVSTNGGTITISATGSSGVSSLNSLTGAITLQAGSGIQIAQNGNTLTVNCTLDPFPGGASDTFYDRDGREMRFNNGVLI